MHRLSTPGHWLLAVQLLAFAGERMRPAVDLLARVDLASPGTLFEHHAGFLEAYSRRVRAAYPRRADGRTLMPLRRSFIVAHV
ncbi:MAG: hypothetical protein IPI67_04460 [Myxococcales bacterium]|nr:hypothetical protein [Myxococcales bacterium]